MPIESGWATVGPFFHAVLPWKDGGVMAGPKTKGEPITIIGRVLDAEEKPIDDAMVELWQANAAGKYNHPEDTQSGEIDPSFVITHTVPLDKAPEMYKTFRDKKDGCIKVVLKP